MMILKLKPEEAVVLGEVLGTYLTELRMEVADTDSMDYRERPGGRPARMIDCPPAEVSAPVDRPHFRQHTATFTGDPRCRIP